MVENLAQKKKRVGRILKALKKAYPDARCALHYSSPWELLVATILSAQCTDQRVNQMTPALFKIYPRMQDFAQADPAQLERDIRPAGYYRSKTRSLIGAARDILERFEGKVPQKMEELITLPGVGRKTANVILGNVFHVPGIPVDTHMIRLSRRLGFTRHESPAKIEADLQRLVPERDWIFYSHRIISHGRACCKAIRPQCQSCVVFKFCPAGRRQLRSHAAIRR